MRCHLCQKDILPTQGAQRIPPAEMALLGGKSGVVGLYPHPSYQGEEEVVVHLEQCAHQFFDPIDNPRLYDDAMEQLRQEVVEELREDLEKEVRKEFLEKFEEVKRMSREDDHEFCVECWEELADPDPDEELMCLWCKRVDCVWTKVSHGRTVYYCETCRKYWNEEEEEVVAA